eukprot:TRINITY_DN20939_c0_g1_i1.p3 TRINITY_DN20939_c0_g1~~TRINITY_DN20939_c0_g1_i1.p3  ORF type:complete len:178 (-),score=7.25 TRINITY_DN20939_c0_g1_i1:247-726(-)
MANSTLGLTRFNVYLPSTFKQRQPLLQSQRCISLQLTPSTKRYNVSTRRLANIVTCTAEAQSGPSVLFDDIQVGDVFKGRVTGTTGFGCFVDIGCDVDGLVHISQVAQEFVRDIRDYVNRGDFVNVKVIRKDEASRKLGLTMIGVQEGYVPEADEQDFQ